MNCLTVTSEINHIFEGIKEKFGQHSPIRLHNGKSGVSAPGWNRFY